VSFVVCERRDPWGRTKIHRDGCVHARRGGIISFDHSSGTKRCTRWHPLTGGVYRTYSEAYLAAARIRQFHSPYDCPQCEPEWMGHRP